VRVRLLLIAVALVVSALAGLRPADPPLVQSFDRAPTSGALAGQPGPDPALPAVISAAAIMSSSVQSQPAVWPRGLVRPAQRASATTIRPAVAVHVSARPVTFPLLI
jgi:hypothetical protein